MTDDAPTGTRDLPSGPAGSPRRVAVAGALRDDILGGVFPPGERLVELQLCERYGCGRATVRSALVELEAEGLIEHAANRGARVRRISVAEAIEITESRAALESLIAAHAARNATPDERNDLVALVGAMEVAVADGAGRTYSELNRRFHARLRDLGRHRVAADLVEKLRNRSAHHQYQLALMPGRPEQSLDQHAAIARAVAAGDPDAAAAAMRAHLHSVADVLRTWNAELPSGAHSDSTHVTPRDSSLARRP